MVKAGRAFEFVVRAFQAVGRVEQRDAGGLRAGWGGYTCRSTTSRAGSKRVARRCVGG